MNAKNCTKCEYKVGCPDLIVRVHSEVCDKYLEEAHVCSGCGRVYPPDFPTCPFCYVEPFLAAEADDGECPTCGYDPADHDWTMGADL